MKTLLAATALLAACHDTKVIIPPAEAVEHPGQMTVTGTATLEVSPDCADLTMTLSADSGKPGAATAQVQREEDALVAALEQARRRGRGPQAVVPDARSDLRAEPDRLGAAQGPHLPRADHGDRDDPRLRQGRDDHGGRRERGRDVAVERVPPQRPARAQEEGPRDGARGGQGQGQADREHARHQARPHRRRSPRTSAARCGRTRTSRRSATWPSPRPPRRRSAARSSR